MPGETLSSSSSFYENEFLQLPQTIQNHIALVGAGFELTESPMSPDTMAHKLGTYRRRVLRIAGRIGLIEDSLVAHIESGYGGVGEIMLPVYSFSIIKEENDWLNAFQELEDFIPVNTVAEFSARSYGWTKNYIIENRPRRKTGNNQSKFLYHKSVLKEIRKLNIEIPLDYDWLTLGAITNSVPRDREWVENRIKQLGIKGEERRAILTGRVFIHYPPQTSEIINKLNGDRPPMAGDWVTTQRVSKALPHRTYKWVKSRLDKYVQMSEVRLDDQGVSRTHFPVYVMDVVQKEDEELRLIPPAGELMTLSELAKCVHKSQGWTKKRLAKIAINGEVRLDRKGRPSSHYSVDVIGRLNYIKYFEESN